MKQPILVALSSYNDNDGHIEECIGVINGLKEAKIFASKHFESVLTWVTLKPEDKPKPNLTLLLQSCEFIDNGWSGRYYSLYRIKV